MTRWRPEWDKFLWTLADPMPGRESIWTPGFICSEGEVAKRISEEFGRVFTKAMVKSRWKRIRRPNWSPSDPKHYTEQEVSRILSLRNEGLSCRHIAEVLGRKKQSVEKKLRILRRLRNDPGLGMGLKGARIRMPEYGKGRLK